MKRFSLKEDIVHDCVDIYDGEKFLVRIIMRGRAKVVCDRLNEVYDMFMTQQLRHHKVADTLQEYALKYERESKEFKLINEIGVKLGYLLEAKDD